MDVGPVDDYLAIAHVIDSGKSVPVPGLILKTEKQVRRFLKSLNRQEMKKKHRNETSKKTELQIEDLEILRNSHKVQLEY